MISTAKSLASFAEVYPRNEIGTGKNPDTGAVLCCDSGTKLDFSGPHSSLREQHKPPLKWMNQIVLSGRYLSELDADGGRVHSRCAGPIESKP
jgi:hypothetical protein